MFFDKKIFLLDYEMINREEAITFLANVFIEKKIVKSSFTKAILSREETFPTGLYINGIGIAIPHTDIEQVNISQIGFMRLKKPIYFNEMGSFNKVIPVKLIFMLALKEPHEQIQLLQRLVCSLQNVNFISELCGCINKESVSNILKKYDLAKEEEI